MMRFGAVLLGSAMLAGMAVPAAAQRVEDRYWLQVLAFRPSINTTAQIGNPNLPIDGTPIDFEQDLGMADTEWLPDVLLGARLGSRFRVELEWYQLNRTATTVLAKEIVWDDTTYRAGANVDSKFKTTIYRGAIGYSFIKRPTWEVGADIGLHATNFFASVEGQGFINNTVTSIRAERKDAWVPLPTIGGFVGWNISPMFSVNARVDWLSLTVGDYSGGITDVWGAVNARVSRHVGLGAGWRYTNYHVDVTKNDWEGYLRYKYNGPAFFLTLAF